MRCWRAWTSSFRRQLWLVDSVEFSEPLIEMVGLLLFGRCLRRTAGEPVYFSHATMRFRLLGPQFRCFFEITKRIGILESALALARKFEDGGVEQVRRFGIFYIKLMRVAERLISRQLLAQLCENGPIEGVQLK